MTTLNTATLQRIKELGGTSSGTADTLDASLALITLPVLFNDSYLFEEFDYDFNDEDKAKLKRILNASSVDYTGQVLPIIEANTKAFYFRNQSPSDDLNGWGLDEPVKKFILELSGASDLSFKEIGYGDGWYPDLYNILLSDPNPDNPIVYSTDHEVSWRLDSIVAEGTLEEFLRRFLTAQEIMDGIRTRV